MSMVAQSHFLSVFRVARRLVSNHAQIAHMGLYRENAACWRILNCNVRSTHSVTQSTWANKEKQEMMAVWPDVVRDVTNAVKSLNGPDWMVLEWIAKVLQYNVLGGNQNRALTLIHAYKSLAPNDQLTEENIRLVHILAWCVEMIQAYMLMMDDIMVRSLLRRGQLCWYRYNDINQAAINDGLMLENLAFYLIRKYFKEKDCYINLIEAFHDIILKILIGQSLDMLSSNFGKKPNLDLYTMNRYNSMVEYKASATIFLSVIAAMNLAGIKDPELFSQAKPILLKLGHLLEVRNDYMGCFGDAKTVKKVDTDIQEGKCTWLVIKALQRATPEQRNILRDCYGVSDPDKVKCVKQLFVELNIADAYLTYQEETYNIFNMSIQQISCGHWQKFLSDLLSFYPKVS